MGSNYCRDSKSNDIKIRKNEFEGEMENCINIYGTWGIQSEVCHMRRRSCKQQTKFKEEGKKESKKTQVPAPTFVLIVRENVNIMPHYMVDEHAVSTSAA